MSRLIPRIVDRLSICAAACLRFPLGKNQNPTETWPASGVLRIAELQQYKRVTGEFKLAFPGGEHIEESFAIDACP